MVFRQQTIAWRFRESHSRGSPLVANQQENELGMLLLPAKNDTMRERYNAAVALRTLRKVYNVV